MRRHLLLFLGLCLLCPAFPVLGAGGQEEDEAPPANAPAASVTLGLGSDGVLVPGWQGAVFTIWNPGAVPVPLRLVVEPLDNTDEHPVQQVLKEIELPPRSRQRQVLYFRAWDGMGQVRLSARGAGRELLPEKQRLLGVLYDVPRVLALTAPSAGWLGAIGEVKVPSNYRQRSSLRILTAGAANLPNLPEALGAPRAILCSGFPLESLQVAQLDALIAWVRQGGHLVLTDTPQGIPRILQERIPPLQGYVSGMLPGSGLEAMAKVGGSPFPPHGAVPCLRGSPRDVSTQPLPGFGAQLLQRFPWGFGHVTVLGIDPSVHPFRGWPGMKAVWTAALSEAPSGWREPWPPESNSWGDRGEDASLVRLSLCRILRTGLARSFPVSAIASLVIAYLLVMALQFYVLRRFWNPAWIVAGIPAVVLLFTVGTLLAGYATRGIGCSGNLVTLRIGVPGGGAMVRSYAALFSSFPGQYDIPLREGALGGLVFPNAESLDDGFHTLVDSSSRTLGGVPVRMWSTRYLSAGAWDRTGTALACQGGRLVNTGSRPISSLILMRRGMMTRVGSLAPGQALDLREAKAAAPPSVGSPFEEAFLESLRAHRLDCALGVTEGSEGSLLTLPTAARAFSADLLPLPPEALP